MLPKTITGLVLILLAIGHGRVVFSGARAVPKMLGYQGYLTDTLGSPIDDSLDMTFRILDAVTGGIELWNENQINVPVEQGNFSLLLGSVNNIPDTVFTQGTDRWLEMIIEGTDTLQPRTRIASAAYAYMATYSDTAEYAKNAATDSDWVRVDGAVLFTADYVGIARGGAENLVCVPREWTHINLGVACTTGVYGLDYDCMTVSGGYGNTARRPYSTVGGGEFNKANSTCATVSGGIANTASASYSTVGGGYADTVAATYGFATNYSSKVESDHNNSAAFTGSHTIGASQVRAALFSTGTAIFTMDHPSEPMNKILNQYAVGASEPMLMYNGTAFIDEDGRVAVNLPDYFHQINRNPRIQLTGVGTSDVYVAEDIAENRFTIGGKPGTKVYWTVTAERKDMHAEIARILTPVEQPKTGDLIGHSLDVDALISTYEILKKGGDGAKFKFRTDDGRRVYEESKRVIEEEGKERK